MRTQRCCHVRHSTRNKRLGSIFRAVSHEPPERVHTCKGHVGVATMQAQRCRHSFNSAKRTRLCCDVRIAPQAPQSVARSTLHEGIVRVRLQSSQDALNRASISCRFAGFGVQSAKVTESMTAEPLHECISRVHLQRQDHSLNGASGACFLASCVPIDHVGHCGAAPILNTCMLSVRLQRGNHSLDGASVHSFLFTRCVSEAEMAESATSAFRDSCVCKVRLQRRNNHLNSTADVRSGTVLWQLGADVAKRKAPLHQNACVRSMRLESRNHSLDGTSSTCIRARMCVDALSCHASQGAAAAQLHASVQRVRCHHSYDAGEVVARMRLL
jgi:hypothetical protein